MERYTGLPGCAQPNMRPVLGQYAVRVIPSESWISARNRLYRLINMPFTKGSENFIFCGFSFCYRGSFSPSHSPYSLDTYADLGTFQNTSLPTLKTFKKRYYIKDLFPRGGVFSTHLKLLITKGKFISKELFIGNACLVGRIKQKKFGTKSTRPV